jgi:hypothetical protein
MAQYYNRPGIKNGVGSGSLGAEGLGRIEATNAILQNGMAVSGLTATEVSWSTDLRLVGVPTISPDGYIEIDAEPGGVELASGEAVFVRYYGVGHENEDTYTLEVETLSTFVPSTEQYVYDIFLLKNESGTFILRDGREFTSDGPPTTPQDFTMEVDGFDFTAEWDESTSGNGDITEYILELTIG